MNPNANYPSSFILRVENSRIGASDNADWTILAELTDGYCTYVDTRKRNYNKLMNECYRVRLITDDGEIWVSNVVNAGAFKAYPYSAEAENVLKQAGKAIEQSGCPGVLLKQKHWGTKCPKCMDFEDDNTVNEHCSYCLGTGFVGGYYNGLSMTIIKDSIQTVETSSEMGMVQGETVQGRCLAYPWVRVGDVWCEDGTNKRYMIVDATPAASYKQAVLVYQITMHKIEYTDVLYSDEADDKVVINDIMDNASVTYTPLPTKTLWDDALEEM
jgi:hypothetical protein